MEENQDIRIVILQRGWVFVGKFKKEGEQCSLENARNIRRWGTSTGLGEIALNGPTANTMLDPCPTVRFHEQTVIASIDCAEEKWQSHL